MSQIEITNEGVVSVRGLTVESRKFAGVAFFALAAQFITVIMLAAAMAPGYDFSEAAISDLGVLPETALLFNGSLILVGLLNLLGGYAFYRSHGRRWLLGTFAVAGVGAVGAGLFPSTLADSTDYLHCSRSCSSTCKRSALRLGSPASCGFCPSSPALSASCS